MGYTKAKLVGQASVLEKKDASSRKSDATFFAAEVDACQMSNTNDSKLGLAFLAKYVDP